MTNKEIESAKLAMCQQEALKNSIKERYGDVAFSPLALKSNVDVDDYSQLDENLRLYTYMVGLENAVKCSANEELTIDSIDKVYFNEPYTIVKWADGTKTKIKCSNLDNYSPEVGVALCLMKKMCGSSRKYSAFKEAVLKKFYPIVPKDVITNSIDVTALSPEDVVVPILHNKTNKNKREMCFA